MLFSAFATTYLRYVGVTLNLTTKCGLGRVIVKVECSGWCDGGWLARRRAICRWRVVGWLARERVTGEVEGDR